MPVQLMQDDDRLTVTDADLVADGDPTTTYTVRPLTKEVRRQVVKTHTKKQPNARTHQMETVTDGQAIAEDLVDYALVGWTGVLWNGAEAPCEKTYKLKLDEMRLSALLERAGLSQVIAAGEQRDSSFRGAA